MRLSGFAAAFGLAALAACAGPGPVVDHRVHEVKDRGLARVAVVPFYPVGTLSRDADADADAEVDALGAIDTANVVSRIVSEALAEAGLDTVPASDLVIAFEGRGQVLPREDVSANAALAASEFGATAILVGRLLRYREREGGPAGTLRPASVAYEVAVHTAPGGELLYSARFDQTQQALSANPLLARKYPGGGTRWLTAAELTRWGADEMAATFPEAMR